MHNMHMLVRNKSIIRSNEATYHCPIVDTTSMCCNFGNIFRRKRHQKNQKLASIWQHDRPEDYRYVTQYRKLFFSNCKLQNISAIWVDGSTDFSGRTRLLVLIWYIENDDIVGEVYVAESCHRRQEDEESMIHLTYTWIAVTWHRKRVLRYA